MAQVFYSKMVGTTFEGRQDVLEHILDEIESGRCAQESGGWKLEVRRQRMNAHDRNAIALHWRDGRQVGFIGRTVAESLAPQVDGGNRVEVFLTEVTGTEPGFHLGANLRVEIGS